MRYLVDNRIRYTLQLHILQKQLSKFLRGVNLQLLSMLYSIDLEAIAKIQKIKCFSFVISLSTPKVKFPQFVFSQFQNLNYDRGRGFFIVIELK